ncbi:MAG TPA: hypothetical protein DCQ06_11320, partial [Myxococcales bacterium]|nr:hypothetical protein [Myxococcales bacterium]
MTEMSRQTPMPITFDCWRLGPVVGLAMGHEVRLACHLDDVSVRVALKRTMPGSSSLVRESMQRERLALSLVDSEHVVSMVGSGVHREQMWNATEWIDGVDLLTLLKLGPLEPIHSCTIIAAIARALVDCHAVDVLHGDLGPTNILVGLNGRVILIDFGLSDCLGAPSRPPGSGTPAYLDPEVAQGEKRRPCSDIYSLGLLWARALLGRAPQKAASKNPAQLTPSQHQVALERAGQYGGLIDACLDIRATHRPTADELLAALPMSTHHDIARRANELWRPPQHSLLPVAAEDRLEALTDPAGETV